MSSSLPMVTSGLAGGALRRQRGDIAASDGLRDARDDASARQDAVGGGAQRGILEQVGEAELLAERLPMAFGDHANEDPAVLGVENIVDRPGMLALGHRA